MENLGHQTMLGFRSKGCQRETKFSVFNDHYRDALRGDNSADGKGFIQGKGERIKIAHGFLAQSTNLPIILLSL